jgi:hypothetical protein
MSDISSSHRKCTATERSKSNADPLVIRKKARKAAKSNTAAEATATQVPMVNFNHSVVNILNNAHQVINDDSDVSHAMTTAKEGINVSPQCPLP